MSLENVLIVTSEEEEKMKSLKERNESEISEDVEMIKDWLKKQPHLPDTDDNRVLSRLLQFNKCSLENTKTKLNYYYALKVTAPELVVNFHPLHESMQKIFDYGMFVPMPRLTPEFSRISLSKLIEKHPKEYDGWEYMKMVVSTYELRLKFDNNISDIIIFDLAHTSLNNLLTTPPTCLQKLNYIIQHSFTLRLKGIHFINTPSYAMNIIGLSKKIFKNKIGERMHVHENYESLYKYVPKENLPEEYGGTEKPLLDLHNNWRKFMESKNNWMIERGLLESNESLRPGKPLNAELFGMEGSFRKLEID